MTEDVTQILSALERGETSSTDKLLPLVYEELRRLARQHMAKENPGHTLQATALVHEAYVRLVGSGDGQHWEGRGHFFAAAAESMRRILIDNARKKQAKKRGGEMKRVDLNEVDVAMELDSETLLFVDEALEKLTKRDPEAAELIKLRFFVGLPNVEAAQLLGVSERKAKSMWAYARAWLYHEMKHGF